MKTFVTAQAGAQPTDAEFAALKQRVDEMMGSLDALSKPGGLDVMIQDAIRPFAAEVALRQKEFAEQAGLKINASSKFLLPKADNDL